MDILIAILVNFGMFCLGYSLCRRASKTVINASIDVSDSILDVLSKYVNKRLTKSREEYIREEIVKWREKLKTFKEN